MRTPDEIRKALAKPFSDKAIKQRTGGGGKEYDYVGHETVTRRLDEATEGTWSSTIDQVWFRQEGAVGKWNPQTRRLEVDPDVVTMVAQVTLTIPGLGQRSDIGVQNIQPCGGEDQYKGAISDALKRAAMRFLVAIDLYGEDIEARVAAAAEPAASSEAVAETKPNGTDGKPKGRSTGPNRETLNAEIKKLSDQLTPLVMQAKSKELFGTDQSSQLTIPQLTQIRDWAQTEVKTLA